MFDNLPFEAAMTEFCDIWETETIPKSCRDLLLGIKPNDLWCWVPGVEPPTGVAPGIYARDFFMRMLAASRLRDWSEVGRLLAEGAPAI